MNESEIYRMAGVFIAAHGSAVAWQHALARAVEQPDPRAVAAWLRVIEAIDELTRTDRRAGEMIQ